MDIQVLVVQGSAITEIGNRHTRQYLPQQQNPKRKDAEKKPRQKAPQKVSRRANCPPWHRRHRLLYRTLRKKSICKQRKATQDQKNTSDQLQDNNDTADHTRKQIAGKEIGGYGYG